MPQTPLAGGAADTAQAARGFIESIDLIEMKAQQETMVLRHAAVAGEQRFLMEPQELGSSVVGYRVIKSEEETMRRMFGKFGITSAAAIIIAVTSIALASPASAQHWHGGGWHGHGGWGWGGFGLGFGTGLALGAAPYYGGYYGYGPYPYDYYGPACYIRHRWVWDGYGHRVWRRVRVCY